MVACIQRVTEASVTIDGQVVGRIGQGLVVLLGVATGDTEKDAQQLAHKICELRIFEDDDGKMNRALLDVGGRLLAVSQFTLLADCRKGRRPSFIGAAPPQEAERLYEVFVAAVRSQGVHTETGRFRAMMQVALVNDGPVTILLDTRAQ
jgi:D-tyrosyl-tRNA(Tyr) deacylase